MTKYVFTNDMTAHVWAQQNQSHGKSSNGQFYFNGPTIYSYRDSWPLGHFLSGGKVLFNTQSYGVTTSKHLGLVRGAVNGTAYENRLSIDDTNLMIAAVEYDRAGDSRKEWRLTSLNETAIKYINTETENALNNAAKRKKASKKEDDINGALYAIENVIKLFNMLSLPVPDSVETARNTLSGDISNLLESHAAELKREKQQIAERKAQKEAKELEDANLFLPVWLRGVDHYEPQEGKRLTRYDLRALPSAWLRVKGDNIETSQGAVFPVEHAKKAFKVLRAMKEGDTKAHYEKNGDKTIRLGHFTIDSVDDQIKVVAGCHVVEWDAIEHCARALNIYP